MNRCDNCGRFAAWEDLIQVELLDLDLHGHIIDNSYQVHRSASCRGLTWNALGDSR